jgi:hypothetical protein
MPWAITPSFDPESYGAAATLENDVERFAIVAPGTSRRRQKSYQHSPRASTTAHGLQPLDVPPHNRIVGNLRLKLAPDRQGFARPTGVL